MNDATRKMVKIWYEMEHCDVERTAKCVSKMIRCGIKQARELVKQALAK